ncbi:leptin receptor gene-related protein-like [Sycon ciliatum]|uniref:leptin receptor gene-related protein-like n=1 Tax=Sycon ciliatum TaxID=27933 RepID=UPI0020AB483A|eukprot:scpid74654/ scgid26883/ Vacuolar protein sorting-associated protein 55 homolog
MSGLLLILSCALHKAWWPLFCIIPIVLSPLPTKMAKGTSDSFSSGNSSVGYELAIFFTTGLIISGLAIPPILAHAGKIVWESVGLAIGGTVLGFLTVLIYRVSSPDEGDGFELMAFN